MKVAFYITAETPNELHTLAEVLSPFLSKLPSIEADLDRYLDTPTTAPKAKTRVEPVAVEEAPSAEPRKNVKPGIPMIGKIGTQTKEEILALVKAGAPLPNKYKEHLKLLWARGEVKYDGTEYYV